MFVFHVGFPKTATTYLQSNVFPHMKGVNYIGKNVHLASRIDARNRAIWKLFDFRISDTSVRYKLEPFLDENKINLISEERISVYPGFCDEANLSCVVLDRIKFIFPEAKIIVGIRDIKSLITSLYREYILQGGTKSFRDFLSIFPVEKYDFKKYINMCKTMFDGVFVFDFDKFKEDKNAMINKLCDFIGCEIDMSKITDKVKHKGYGKKQIEVARMLNRIFKTPLNKNGIIPMKYFELFPPALLLQNRFSYWLNYEREILSDEDKNFLEIMSTSM